MRQLLYLKVKGELKVWRGERFQRARKFNVCPNDTQQKGPTFR